MYTAFFHLKQAPFSIAPDPNYLFMSERHREALAHLLYGVGSGGGFVLLTGEIGAGKTTVCRCFLEQIPERCKVAYIFNPKLSVGELLHTICDEFGIPVAGAKTVKDHVDALNAFLLETHAKGQNNVLIIDEAQNLSPMVLEQLRLLTNLETNEKKLLQIILIGQPELRTMLTKPEMEQLAQRVIARYHLGPLSVAETGRYIDHRLGVAGLTHESPFGKGVMPLIQRLTGGVPRRINLMCDRALLGAYANGKHQVPRQIVIQAAREVFAEHARSMPRMPIWLAAGMAMLVLVAGALWLGRASVLLSNKGAAQTTLVGKDALRATPGVGAASAAMPDQRSTGPGSQAAAVVRGEQANAAFAELAALWGKTLAGPDPCQSAPKKNLRCFSGSGGWDEIHELGRPVLLALKDGAHGSYYALLLGQEGDKVALSIAGKPVVQSLAEVNARFGGEFTTLWNMPRRFRDEIFAGDRGSDVDWVAAQLAKLQKLPKPKENQPFDQDLANQVRKFQAERKIKVDGLVGPKTWMHLNQAVAGNEPRLQDKLPPSAAMERQ